MHRPHPLSIVQSLAYYTHTAKSHNTPVIHFISKFLGTQAGRRNPRVPLLQYKILHHAMLNYVSHYKMFCQSFKSDSSETPVQNYILRIFLGT